MPVFIPYDADDKQFEVLISSCHAFVIHSDDTTLTTDALYNSRVIDVVLKSRPNPTSTKDTSNEIPILVQGPVRHKAHKTCRLFKEDRINLDNFWSEIFKDLFTDPGIDEYITRTDKGEEGHCRLFYSDQDLAHLNFFDYSGKTETKPIEVIKVANEIAFRFVDMVRDSTIDLNNIDHRVTMFFEYFFEVEPLPWDYNIKGYFLAGYQRAKHVDHTEEWCKEGQECHGKGRYGLIHEEETKFMDL